jgi:hypothetical protein
MGKLLHTYDPVPTSMATVPVSRWDYTFCVSTKFIFRQDTHFYD